MAMKLMKIIILNRLCNNNWGAVMLPKRKNGDKNE